MLLSQMQRLVRRFGTHPRKRAGRRRAAIPPSFHNEQLEARLLLSVTGGADPTLDLTDRLGGVSDGDSGLGTAPEINEALFTNDIDIAVFGSGTGLINPFMQVDDVNGPGKDTPYELDGVEMAYNTSGNNPVPDLGSSANFNHDLLLSDIPIVYVGDTAYYEFRLDINENDTDIDRWLSHP